MFGQQTTYNSLGGAADRRLQIIDAAAVAFMEQGYVATSIDDVARSLGCTKGLIYYHFRNKAELFVAIHRQIIELNLSEARLVAAGDGSPRQRLERLARSRLRSIVDHLPYQRVSLQGLEMLIMGKTSPSEREALSQLSGMYEEYENVFIEVIGEGMATGEFAEGDPRMVSKPLLGALNWMIMWYRPRPTETETDLRRLIDLMTDFVVRGLGAEPPPRPTQT